MTVTWCQQGAGRGRASGVLPRVSNRKARGERSWAWARKTRRLEARAAVSLVVFRGGHARPRPVIVAGRKGLGSNDGHNGLSCCCLLLDTVAGGTRAAHDHGQRPGGVSLIPAFARDRVLVGRDVAACRVVRSPRVASGRGLRLRHDSGSAAPFPPPPPFRGEW